MADELSMSTTNQAGDGWVDQVPGPVHQDIRPKIP